MPVAAGGLREKLRRTALLTRSQRACTGLAAGLILQVWVVCAGVLLPATSRAEAACVDPAASAHATVAITRHFDAQEQTLEPDLAGVAGTGWFLSPRSMVTVAHVAEAMHLTAQAWTEIEIRDGDTTQSIPVRLSRLAGEHAEKIAVLELRTAFPHATVLRIGDDPLVADERVMSVAYPGEHLRVAEGRFVEYGANSPFAGTALLELYDGNDRLALDHGASGAPVLDCEGRVVAVVSNVLTQTMQFPSRVIRISTAWNTPNVVSVPIQALKDFTPAE